MEWVYVLKKVIALPKASIFLLVFFNEPLKIHKEKFNIVIYLEG